MVVTQHARQFPNAVLALPQLDEARFTGSVGRLGFWMHKAVHAHLDGSVALHVIDLQRTGDEHPLGVASTDVVFNAFRELLPAQRYAALVVIELDVVRQQAIEGF